jgi:hypothetical protein
MVMTAIIITCKQQMKAPEVVIGSSMQTLILEQMNRDWSNPVEVLMSAGLYVLMQRLSLERKDGP